MATQPPRTRTREEQRRLSIRTLAIASAASAAAAVVTSQIWIHGTWIAAALTPVIVSLVSELLHRPTEAVARRMTTDRTAIRPEPAGGAQRTDTRRVRELQYEQDAPVSVYGGGRSRRRKFAVGLVAATAALGFAIGALALTVPELIFGQPLGNRNGGTTIFGGGGKQKQDRHTPTQTVTQQTTQPKQQTQPRQRTQPQQPKQQTAPQQTTPQPRQQTSPAQPPPQGQPGTPAPR